MSTAPKLGRFYRLVALGEVGSTNDEAMALAAQGAAEGTLVWARCQTSGRGRRARSWVSPPGNLYLSLVLRPKAPAVRIPEIAFVAALGAGDAIRAVVPESQAINFKWPNDVLVDGEKVAGVLLEAGTAATPGAGPGGDWLVLGLGINVASHPQGLALPATSLRAQGATSAGVAEVLEGFCGAFAVWYQRWRDDGFGAIRAAWLGRAAGLGGPVRVRLETESLDGVFLGLDQDGALVLGDGAGHERRITAGDVFFPPQAARGTQGAGIQGPGALGVG